MLPVVATLFIAAPSHPWDPELGSYSFRISCVPPAQRLFDLGLNLAFNFNQPEAQAAFTRCIASAPECAMCFWGVAYAHAPFLNQPVSVPADVAAGSAAA